MHNESDGAMPGEEELLRSAIARRRCVQAIYNRGEVVLAPYLLYKRHDELHVAAALVMRDGAAPKASKVGVYRVKGLAELRPTTRLFTAKADLMAEVTHPADEVLATALMR
ncbi:MAG TPA: hypothetical protein VE567_07765 [Sphingomonas sp.]|nr:hypothetical protein [Sphingomonas sp.]